MFRHGPNVWGIRFTCGAGHVHEETVGRIKSDAIRVHAARRQRVHDDPCWCPSVERREARNKARADQEHERQRVTFHDYARDFITWATVHHRSWREDGSRLSRVLQVLGARKLDEIKRAIRLALVTVNPVKAIPKLKEPGGRVVYLPPATKDRPAYEEEALVDALPPDLRPLFTVSVHMGLRWSEQVWLQ